MRLGTCVLAMAAGLLLLLVGPALPVAFGMATEHDTAIRYCVNHRGVQSLSVSRGFMQITDHGIMLCKDGTTEDYDGQSESDVVFMPRYQAWASAFDLAPLLGTVMLVAGFGFSVFVVRYGYAFE